MGSTLKEKLEEAVWIAHSLFDRGKATGSVANLSFLHEEKVYISASGTCFGTLQHNDFAIVDLKGKQLNELRPSKELPLHLSVFNSKSDVGAVIHTHSTYSVLWSCVQNLNILDCIPDHTPYLKMQLGTVGLVPYKHPGSIELFEKFDDVVNKTDGWLLSHHGPVVPGKNLMSAFYALEEMEESTRIAWELRNRL